jgi:hypothetical protein
MIAMFQTFARDVLLHDVFAAPRTLIALIVRALFSFGSISIGLIIGVIVWRAGHPVLAAVSVAFGIERPIIWVLFQRQNGRSHF